MLLISCTSDKVWNVPLVSACCLCNLQSTTGPFRTTPTSTTGICGSRCTKELSPCRCSSLWRHSGPVCRYHISPCDPHLWLYTITSLFQMSYMWVLKSTYLDFKKKFLPAVALQSLLGNLDSAVRTFQNYYSVWRQFGGLPEFYSIPQGTTVDKREGYPLRPGESFSQSDKPKQNDLRFCTLYILNIM